MACPTMKFYIILCLNSVQCATNILDINDGQIVGNVEYFGEKRVEEYLGIPYAMPPTGNRRFMSPEPPAKWGSSTIDTLERKPLCAQSREWEGFTSSEDCLFLDVYTPSNKLTNDKKAVMVWIHGGYFGVDWHPAWYNGRALASTGDVIVVIVNYRLGALGFLSTDDDVIPGNMAMFDQVLSFQWIQDNIHHFGGDPNRVMIFGQSAGAVMVKFHSISPLSGEGENRLFHNVLVESGQQMAYNSDPVETAHDFARNVGCLREFQQSHDQFLSCIQGAPLDDIIAASDREPIPAFSWTPVIDRKFLMEKPTTDYLATPGLIDRFNLMQGCNSGEVAMLASAIRTKDNFERIMKPLLRALIPIDVENPDFWYDLESFYLPSGDPSTTVQDEWREAYISLGMDTAYSVFLFEYAVAAQSVGANMFAYNFMYPPSEELTETPRVEGDWNAPWHGDDLMFVFGWPILQDKGLLINKTFLFIAL